MFIREGVYFYQQHVFEMAMNLVDPPGGDIAFPRVLCGQVSVCTCSVIAQNVYEWPCLLSVPAKLPSFFVSYQYSYMARVCYVCEYVCNETYCIVVSMHD